MLQIISVGLNGLFGFLTYFFCPIDLKKTLAVLLDNIMLRLSKLESKVDTIIINGSASNLTNGTVAPAPSSANSEKVNVAGMLWIHSIHSTVQKAYAKKL